jgi:hypothetical protein
MESRSKTMLPEPRMCPLVAVWWTTCGASDHSGSPSGRCVRLGVVAGGLGDSHRISKKGSWGKIRKMIKSYKIL